MPSQCPRKGNIRIMTMSNRKVADMAVGDIAVLRVDHGAMAAMADPPQMPVPAEIRLLSFQLSPRLRPTR